MPLLSSFCWLHPSWSLQKDLWTMWLGNGKVQGAQAIIFLQCHPLKENNVCLCNYPALVHSVPSLLADSFLDQFLCCFLMWWNSFSSVKSPYFSYFALSSPVPFLPTTAPELRIYSAHNQFLSQFGWPWLWLYFCDFCLFSSHPLWALPVSGCKSLPFHRIFPYRI